MQWKIKSRVQNLVSLLPSTLSNNVYYWLQRNFGGLRTINPQSRIQAALDIWQLIKQHGKDPKDKIFFEIGTGRIPTVPLSYWLMGAKKIITIDLNRYLRWELLKEAIGYIVDNQCSIEKLLGELLDQQRLKALVELYRSNHITLNEVLKLCNIEYIAPGDASDTKLADNTIDFHTSFTVFEHIPEPVLLNILKEGERIIKNGGLFVHNIDYTDHFSHSDRSISVINFLQYSDVEWDKYAGNGYMYMNRLRHDDFLAMFESIDHQVLLKVPQLDEQSFQLLKSGQFKVDDRFSAKSLETLSISGSWFVSELKNKVT